MKYFLFSILLVLSQGAWSSEKGCALAQELEKFNLVIGDGGYLSVFQYGDCDSEFTVDHFISFKEAFRIQNYIWPDVKKRLIDNIAWESYPEAYKKLAKELLIEVEREDSIVRSSLLKVVTQLGLNNGDYQFTEKFTTLSIKDNSQEKIILDCQLKQDSNCIKGNLVIETPDKLQVLYRINLTPEFLKHLKHELRRWQRFNYFRNSKSAEIFETGIDLAMYTFGLATPLLLVAAPVRLVEEVIYAFTKRHKKMFTKLLQGKNITTSLDSFDRFKEAHGFTLNPAMMRSVNQDE